MLALSTFEAGVAVTANLAFTGWDTHSNNIDNTTNRYTELFLLLSDLRTSLFLFLDDTVWNNEKSDYRQLLLADYLYLDERLVKISLEGRSPIEVLLRRFD